MKKTAVFIILTVALCAPLSARTYWSTHRACGSLAIGSGVLYTLYYFYEYASYTEADKVLYEESLREAIALIEDEWAMAIDSMYEVNTLIDRGMNASASGDPEVAAQLYWVAASRTRAIANLYRDSTETLFNLTYKDGYVFGDIARFQSFILQTCTLSCNTYKIAAQLYKAAGDSASAERILEAKECIHRIKGLHEDNPLNAQELRLAFSLELKQSLLHLGAVPQFQPENLELNPDLADAIEKINIETHSIQHGAAIQVFDEL